MVKQFYVCDEISTIMPRAKHYVSVNSEGKKIHLQKQLTLCNLKEAYTSFKEQNPEELLDFSKFAVMAKKCISAAQSAILQCMCVCVIIHQNVKLISDAKHMI
jgi:hypothetical protein